MGVEGNTIGSVASFGFDAGQFFGPALGAPTAGGSVAGVPATRAIAGQTDASNSGGSPQTAVAYGRKTAVQPAHSQPTFWLLVMLVIAVIMLAHVSHVGLK